MLFYFSKIFLFICLLHKNFCDQFDIYPYEAVLPKVIRTECRSYDGRKVCAELYNFHPQPRIPGMICEVFGHYSYRCFFGNEDFIWVENIYKPYVESLKLDEDDPLVGTIDFDYKSYASIIRDNCIQNCPIIGIEETIPVVHIPYDASSYIPVENSIVTDRYGKVKKYQKMTFIDGKKYFVEVPLQKVVTIDEAYLCNEKRRGSVLYDENKNPCQASSGGKEHITRVAIPTFGTSYHLNLFNNDVFEVCDFEVDCKLVRSNIQFNFDRNSDLFKEMSHKYGHLYENRRTETKPDIGEYSRNWDDTYRREYERQQQELARGEESRQYSRRCYSSGRCRYISIQITAECDNQYDSRNCNYNNQRVYDREDEYRRRVEIGRKNIEKERERIRIETELSRKRIAQLEEYARRAKTESDRQIEQLKQTIEERQRIHEEKDRIIDNDIDEKQYQDRDDLNTINSKKEVLPKRCNYEINVRSC